MRYFVLLLIANLIAMVLPAQQRQHAHPADPVPHDPALRTGTLSNGMRYYIRKNNYPEGYADFQIFHAVGAVHEEDHQNGLAHFLEHMAFKGLKHFPDNQLIDYMEGNGIKFGANLNAATSYDHTYYILQQVPVSREGLIDSCLLVLADWSGAIEATQQAIDLERGVIREEFRTRSDLKTRIGMALQPYYYQGSRYADRTIIGDMDIISNFERADLLDFYHTWYRPELQAIAIVGDIDPGKMEQKILERFSTIPNPATAAPDRDLRLPDNDELILGMYSDPEAGTTQVNLLFKHDLPAPNVRSHASVYVRQYLDQAIVNMLNERWGELSRKEDLAVSHLGFSYGDYVADKAVFAISAAIKPGAAHIEPGLALLYDELARAHRYGFTEGEWKRVKANLWKSLERRALEADKRTNGSFINAYRQHFLRNRPLPDLDTQIRLLGHALDTVSLAYLNDRMRQYIRPDNQVMTFVTAETDRSGVPSREKLVEALQGLTDRQVTAYEPAPEVSLEPSIEPVAGKVIAEASYHFGSLQWTLSNGAQVFLLPTTLQNDEILLHTVSAGGRSVISDEDLASSHMVVPQLMNAGLGKLDANEVRRALAGKIVYVTPYLSDFHEGMGCSASPDDVETLLKMIYMYHTEPRFDQKTLHQDLRKFAESMEARIKNPMAALMDTVAMARADYHARSLFYLQDTAQVDMDRVQAIFDRHFGNPADFAWIFTGTIDTAVLKPLVEKYIGSLPPGGRHDEWRDLGKRSPQQPRVINFNVPMETPKAITFMEYTREVPFSLENLFGIRLLKDVVEIRLKELLRDDRSGIYTTEGEGSLAELPVDKLQFIISFQTDPDRMEELTQVVFDELHRLAEDGIPEVLVAKSKEYMHKAMDQAQKSNRYWEMALRSYVISGRDHHSGYREALDGIQGEDLQTLLQGLLRENRLVHVTMGPY